MELTKHWAAGLDDYVIDLAWTKDGGTLAAASAAGPITLFTAEDGAVRATFPGHEPGTNCIAAGPAALLATGGQDGAVKLWDTAAGQHVATAALGTPWVDHIAWRPAPANSSPQYVDTLPPAGGKETSSSLSAAAPGRGGGMTLCAAAGKRLSFVRGDGTVLKTLPDAPKSISAFSWHPSGGCVAAAHFGAVHLWDADDFVLQKGLPYGNGIHALAWSPNGQWLVSGNQDPSVHLWQPEHDLELQMSGYEAKVKHLSFDRGGRWLATSGGGDACLWDFSGAGPEGREPGMLPHEAPVCAVAFQHAHGLLASAAQDGAVKLWSPERRPQPLRATVRLPSPATKLAWSPDDRYLAIGSEQGVVYVLICKG